ncbi:MAG TPA: diaminopimelate epimerase [Candidatus Gastranaerophilales bacterium]|nr:diaminopimelate epimerase [Candidatus Gastranaerophilales bacterium]
MKFTKMQGLGNDFIILEAEEFAKTGLSYSELAKKLCDRNFGIGADGLIIVNPPEIKSNCDISWRIFNSDGSEPQMCGNGIRCFAKYVYNKGIMDKKVFSVSTLAGEIIPEIVDDKNIMVNMGEPVLEASKIPVKMENLDCVIDYPLEIEGKEINITAVSMGNPHCIVFTDEDSAVMAKKLGPKLENHEIFPEKTNVELVKIISRNKIKVDVWERGCGITLACGTGACASVVASALNEHTENKVEVELPGGALFIEWDKATNKIFMTGGCEFVFSGEYFLP